MALPTIGTPSIRKKRNFKALQLDVAEIGAALVLVEVPPPSAVASPEASPASSRAAPGAPSGRRKKPPIIDLLKSKGAAAAGTCGKPSLFAGTGSSLGTSPGAAQKSNYCTALSEQITALCINRSDPYLDLRREDLMPISELGQGNGGTVSKVMHLPTKTIMAKKVMPMLAKPAVRKQNLRELEIMHRCHSQYIVSFHGAFVADPHICICMEYMDKGSLDSIYKKNGPIDIEIVGKIAHAVLQGLTYLYDVHGIVHRDVKPSNMLCNSKGEIKICDFGVSEELISSAADMFVGTSPYMSPGRIQGARYMVTSDVWSTGISLIELALGRFPLAEEDESDSDLDNLADLQGASSPDYPDERLSPLRVRTKTSDPGHNKKYKRKSKGLSLRGGEMTMSILELLQHVVNEPAPRLMPIESFPKESHDFIDACLQKEREKRPTPKELLRYDWMVNSAASKVDLERWTKSLL
ncbi:MAP kinase kinase (MEK) [Tulasnella sp. 330]|nr:MAP kinase kinase (MEK) [Tulasnella sp. 330]KAG8870909.1 MAP kinase kinase (MEK) [Tulasnella sp. 331]KAG8890555.1 MAP kinase kinase (MEK) [Tulasnella sp. 332]